MDLTVFVERVQRELRVAAEAGGPDAVALAERLTAPLTSTFHLTLLEALSSAADEITTELAPGSVELRLRGGEPSFAVTTAPAMASSTPDETPSVASSVASSVAPSEASPAADEVSGDEAEGAVTRINFRVPEQLKGRIEEAAAAQGRSVNAWLTRAASAALRAPAMTASAPPAEPRPTRGRSTQRYTGWVS